MQFLAIVFLLNCTIWPWLLIPLLLLSWLLGWFFGSSKVRKIKSRVEELEMNIRKSTARNTELDKEVSGLRFDYEKLGRDNKEVRSRLADTELELNNSQNQFRSLELQKSDWEQTKFVGTGGDSGISKEAHEALQLKLANLEQEYANLKSSYASQNTDAENALRLKYNNLEKEFAVLNAKLQSNNTNSNDALQLKYNNLEREIASLKSNLQTKTSDYDALYSKYTQLDRDNSVTRDKLSATERALKACEEKSTNDYDSAGFVSSGKSSDDAKNTGTPIITPPVTTPTPSIKREEPVKQTGMGANFKATELQIIEGVGPKIEGLLKAAGYKTWADIANADISELQKVLDDAGPRYRIHNPQKWSEQAGHAAKGNWDELVKYQKWLDVGNDGEGGQSKVEKLYFKSIGFAAAKPNDLKVVEGIGPKIESLLKAAGMNTWVDLSKATVPQIQEVLTAAGDRYRLADPKTWPKQAELAANGKWTELKEYQDFLSGGKE